MNPSISNKIKIFFTNPRVVLVVWLLLSIGFSVKQHTKQSYNNYKIFKGVFLHTINQTSLYTEYPEEYFDRNHYGPFFSVIIAPFALLPDWLGITLWNISNAIFLYIAVILLPLSTSANVCILWLTTNELATSLANQQSNPAITAAILLAFIGVYKGTEKINTFFIAAGFWVKLYSIVAIAFFFFSKKKKEFVIGLSLWGLVCFVLPMLFSSPSFVLQSYNDWIDALRIKNTLNHNSLYQDISLIGFIRRTTGYLNLSSLYVIVPCGILYLFSFFYQKKFNQIGFQMLTMLSCMIGVNIFSSGSESSTYIISFTAICIWLMMHKKPYSNELIILFVITFIITSLSPTDFVPKAARIFARQYSLKALPCALIWFYLVWQMITYKNRKEFLPQFQYH